MVDCLKPAALCLVLFFAAAPLRAQPPLPDPTRPPPGVAGLSGLAEERASDGPVLQSVLIPGQGKAMAVISGKQIRLGEKYGDSRLVRVSEGEALLEGPSGRERLLLTPGIEKTELKGKNVAAGRGQRGSKP